METLKMSKKLVTFSLLMGIVLLTQSVTALTDSLTMNDYIIDLKYDEADVRGGETFILEVTITNDDTITKENINLQLDPTYPFDIIGDDEKDLGDLNPGSSRSTLFRIEIDDSVEEDDYEIEITIEDNSDDDTDSFYIEVENERAELIVGNLITKPGVISPNTQDVSLLLTIENVGEKDAKVAEIVLNTPQGFEPSFTNNNRFWVGKLGAGESKEVEFFVDVDELVNAGSYTFTYDFTYEDEDDRTYNEQSEIPFLVKSSPYLEVLTSSGSGNAGETGQLTIVIINTGDESAEAVDVRILKENSQPFNFDVRSMYLGELEPGESGTVIFDIDTNSDATLNDYDFKVFIRAKGDSDHGDNNIYTFNRRATYRVTGTAPNKLLMIGLLLFVGILFVILIKLVTKKRRR